MVRREGEAEPCPPHLREVNHSNQFLVGKLGIYKNPKPLLYFPEILEILLNLVIFAAGL